MRPLLALAVLAALLTRAAASQPAPSREIDNVAAFARLYGVVRYFYPSDAAAALDWNRFAVHGVKQVRAAADVKALERALTDLFSPLGPGFVLGTTLPLASPAKNDGDRLVAWRYLGPGFSTSGAMGPYKGKRTNRQASADNSIDGFVTLMQTIPAEELRGKAIRLRGLVRAAVSEPGGSAALWLRVDRPERMMGFFDNMGDRPVRDLEWREYSVEGSVAEDAVAVAFGAMASGAVTADFDRIELSVRNHGGLWVPVQIADPGFELLQSKAWFRAGTSRTARTSRPSGEAPQGDRFLRFMPAASAPGAASDELFDDAAPVAGAHAGIDLGSGLKARVPLALADGDASEDAAPADRLDALRKALEVVRAPDSDADADTRLADVVVAWNVFRHFYPYWPEAGIDWDARLRPQLQDAYEAKDRDAHRDALRRLVADARDGHGRVIDARLRGDEMGVLPLQFARVEGRIVITASDPGGPPIGAVVSAIDGVAATERLSDAMALVSGTTQWKQARGLQEIAACRKGGDVTLGVDTGGGAREISLPCEARGQPAGKRPAPIAELSPGIWYVDLTRAQMAQIKAALDQLAGATGVVFDLRGYPTDAGARILPHLLDRPEEDRWMHVAKITGPSGQSAGWNSFGWNMQPEAPRLAGRIVFMTEGRAISYAESVMGYVADRKLGTIVGSATAGTNGNVAVFEVPGGFRVSFTGMRVTRHDGQSPFHLVGVQPDVPVAPTLASIREGRDAVLERAIDLVRKR
jgi:hypothetical protein